jgi:N6-adenosine-specific RNA methylase IME4
MIEWSRPHYKLHARAKKHRQIRDAIVELQQTASFGPFPLIYADPPWRFETFTPAGGGRSPDQKYPTLSDDEIIDFAIDGRPMREIAHKTAALFLWCTSSNIPLALDVMRAWGFVFKASAVWDKGIQGMGLIFRNWHEVILYGSRGDMPGPVFVPPSIFRFARGEHSVKPPEIRQAIEQMYPDYLEPARLELFARGSVEGWTTYGFEARKSAA